MLAPSARSLWLITGAAISWGTVGVCAQLLYTHHLGNPLSVAFWRLAIATPFFLVPSSLSARGLIPMQRRDVLIVLGMGMMQALYQTTYTAAIVYTGVTVATLIALCGAPILLGVYDLTRQDQRPTPRVLVILLVALIGTMLLVTASDHSGVDHLSLSGSLLALLSAAGYAAFIVLGRRLPHTYSSLQINGLAFGLAALLLLPGMIFAPIFLAYPHWGWAVLVYLGVIPTAVGYGLFQIGIRAVPATIVGIVTLCEPLTAALLAWLIFRETLGVGGISGAVLLLGAMVAMLRLPGGSGGEQREAPVRKKLSRSAKKRVV